MAAPKGGEPANYTTEELADLLRVSPAAVRMMHSRGDAPPSFRLGKKRLWPRAAYEAWVRARTA